MKFRFIPLLLFFLASDLVPAQQPGIILGSDTTFRVITTALPFLLISPDARSAALGDVGAATSADANSAFWNPAKMVFIEDTYGGAISWTPWLGKIVNDMWISYLTGFYKFTREQAVVFSMKYFDLGDISFRGDGNQPLGDFNPREAAFDITYSRLLTESFSVGLTGRYMFSNLTGSLQTNNSVDARPINSVAVDLGVFYTKDLQSARNAKLGLAAVITNIGPKVSYTDNANRNFIPTNLRIGASYTTEVDPFNSFSFSADLNKLMVPTINRGQSVLSGMFSSFTDAPGGLSEELKEIILNTGVEYWYDKTFAARIGYFLESREKGNRKYLTLGLGFRSQKSFGIDVAYLVPTNTRENPLAETLRFSLLYQIKKTREESVTD
jgi:hypothetical protein